MSDLEWMNVVSSNQGKGSGTRVIGLLWVHRVTNKCCYRALEIASK